jgi:hypothetical protein
LARDRGSSSRRMVMRKFIIERELTEVRRMIDPTTAGAA